MVRTKKDPGVRREVFINAATELYMEKGYDSVSIRDVLDAVADKTASPSVFYYYFSSKDELYRACVEAVAKSYLSSMSDAFSAEGKTTVEWMLALVSGLEEYLMNERNLIITGKSSPNRMFILDMREQVTLQITRLWADSLKASFGFRAEEAQSLAQFLAGGVGEIMFQFMQEGRHDQAAVYDFTEKTGRFVINAMGLPDVQKKQMITALKEKHERNGI